MSRSFEQYHRDVIAGRHRGLRAGMLRGALGIVEPIYSGVVSIRNAMFGRLRMPVRVGRPVISVGNITTGGTGKTPVVRWLVEQLTTRGRKAAILTRGYRGGDEQQMLRLQLPGIAIAANPSRVEGARQVLGDCPDVDVFVLDDGFQHRQMARDFDLVLIDASNPFGFGHVLPRGLLREPLSGLARASAFLVTRCEAGWLADVEQMLRRHNPAAPVFHSRHNHAALLTANGQISSMELIHGARVATVCGIGNPESFESQLSSDGALLVASVRFPDHHPYIPADVQAIQEQARGAGAQLILTTEKDWTKVGRVIRPDGSGLPWYRVELRIGFEADDESRLLALIEAALARTSGPSATATR